MPLVLSLLLYLLLAAAVAALGLWLARGWRAERPPWLVVGLLTLLPLCFTVGGFLPGLALSPTPMLSGVPPWAEPERQEVMEAEPPANPLLLDPLSQFIPWRAAAREDLLFNPAQGSGAALAGNGQSAVLFPSEVMARWLSPFRAVSFSQAARLLIGAWGMFLAAWVLVRSPWSAWFAAVAWTGCGFVQLWRLHPHTLVAAMLPWVLLALFRLAARPGPLPALGLAAAGALAVAGGHPETLLHGLLFALAAVAWWWWAEGRHGGEAGDAREPGDPEREPALRQLLRFLGWGAAAALLAALLSAPLLLPFTENLVVSSEWGLRHEGFLQVEAPLPEALDRLRPNLVLLALGDPISATWEGPENLAELGGGSLGTAALLLAALALAGRRRKLAGGLLAIGLLGLAWSVYMPWIGRPLAEIPLLRESLIKRLSLWWAMAVPLAVALGLEAWGHRCRAEEAVRRRGLVWIAGATAAVAAVVAWAAGAPFQGVAQVTWGEWGALVLAALALTVSAWRPRWIGLPVVLLFALLVPRAVLFAYWIPPVTAAGFYAESLSIQYVAERVDELPPEGWRVAGLRGALVPHSAAFYGLEEARAYDPMTFAPYQRFVALAGVDTGNGWVRIHDPARPALAFLGVRWVFEHPSAGDREEVLVAHRDHGGMVYENPRALPRAFVPRTLHVHATDEEAAAEAERIDDFADKVAVSRLDVGPLPPTGEGRLRDNGTAEVRELVVDGRRVTATVEAAGAAFLATSQPAIPGWRVLLDGEEEPNVMRVNGAFLGLVVPEGTHRVELVYAPASWRWGWLLFALGALLVIALAWWGRRA
ncbi:MAG TPA: YfhO family protein [Thermoanaerobaculia bacterium]|nr:YfhO family protein [Thermoanaerobaculia bacterium]